MGFEKILSIKARLFNEPEPVEAEDNDDEINADDDDRHVGPSAFDN